MESKKYNKLMNIIKRNRLTGIKNKLVVTSGEREREGVSKGRRLRGTNYYV